MAGERYEPYRERAIAFRGVREAGGHRIKVYSIVHGGGAFEPDRFEAGLRQAFEALPRPARAGGRPGIGFAIAHQGRGANYVVLAWWDRENELPTKVFVAEQGEWHAAADNESFCVWDLEVFGHEREAYIGTVLAGEVAEGAERYLALTYRPVGSP